MNRKQFITETQAEGFDAAELVALIKHREPDAPVSASDSYESLFDYYITQHFPELEAATIEKAKGA
jgi:hypothetical protein